MILSKNVNDKKCAPKLIFFNEKKIEKDCDDFWHGKLTLKVKFWHFLKPPHYTNSQNSIIVCGMWVCWFLGKNLSNFVPPLENSATHTTLYFIAHSKLEWVWIKSSVQFWWLPQHKRGPPESPKLSWWGPNE